MRLVLLTALIIASGACGVPRGSLEGDAGATRDGDLEDAPPPDVPIDVPPRDTCMEEECNGFDDDCDGNVDETCSCETGMTQTCGCGGEQLCEDGMWAACLGERPSSPEVCNMVDDDCDGRTDEEPTDASPQFADMDGDGFGDRTMGARSCDALPNHADNGMDCDDGNSAINPDATEVCNGDDDDCDTRIDEAGTTTVYRDADGDGFGDPSMSMDVCMIPGGYVTDGTDCNDDCELCYPGFPGEICDGVDNDCSDATDEGDCECTVHDESTGIYLLCDDIAMNWNEAQTYCMDRGGDLVSINDMAEQDVVWALMEPSGDSFWVGGEDTDDGDWEWVDGTDIMSCEGGDTAATDCSCLQYCNWRADRPNNTGEDCVWLEHNRNGTWDDQNCGEDHEFVCEL